MSDWAWPLTCDPSIGAAAWPLAVPRPAVASAVAGFAPPLRQGCTTASQPIMPPTATMARIQPSAVVPTPTYLRPDAKITKPMIGLMYLSGARDDKYEPISTAGTLPMTIDAVTPNSTCPNTSAPSAAAAVSGTAWVRSVPTSWLAPMSGYTNSSRTIISEPAPTDVMPTISPPTAPISKVGKGLTVSSEMVASRLLPDLRSRT